MKKRSKGLADTLAGLFARRGDRFEDYTEAVRNLARDKRFSAELTRQIERLPGFRPDSPRFMEASPVGELRPRPSYSAFTSSMRSPMAFDASPKNIRLFGR